MVITVLSNKPNSGQSITAINLANILYDYSGKKSLLVDTHDHSSSQIEEYLSKNELNNGFDNFINRYNMNKNSREAFQYCRNTVSEAIDFMALSRVTIIEDNHVDELFKITCEKENGYENALYGNVIVDFNQNNPNLTRRFLDKSDYILVIVEQNSYSIKLLSEELKKYSERIIIVVNKYNSEIKYNFGIIKKELSFRPVEVLPLSYNALIPNSINDQNVVGITRNSKFQKTNYFLDLENIINKIGFSRSVITKRSIFSL